MQNLLIQWSNKKQARFSIGNSFEMPTSVSAILIELHARGLEETESDHVA